MPRNVSLAGTSEMVVGLYRRAPASITTIASLALSYLFRLAYEDYLLFKAIGQGGLGSPSFFSWLVHTIILRPLALPSKAALDPTYLPLDDEEWTQRCSEAHYDALSQLPKRAAQRPLMFGIIPHRQVEDVNKPQSEMQTALIQHLEGLAKRFPEQLTLAMSTYEATDSPCLFVTHDAAANPTSLSRLYLGGTPAPKRTLAKTTEGSSSSGSAPIAADPSKHEFAHIHLSEGSLHVVLSPQDARVVLTQQWGELHRLAGVGYRGYWSPPYWLPSWLFAVFKQGGHTSGAQCARWGYQRRFVQRHANDRRALRGTLLPPTYTSVYAPKTEEQLLWTKRIIDASVAWVTGTPL